MATAVKVIPPREMRPDILRVAAYCRVSSDSADQLHSYAAQIKAYTEMIRSHEGWELVDVYADEGLTGTRMDKRDDFNRLLADCRKGKIDKVMIKSISRFARNARDCLASLRELSRLGVSVQFEKENIDTGTLTTELMVGVSGALAQQESISISQNQRMSYKRRMERGEFITCYAPYGYDIRGKELVVNPAQAKIVRYIFERYINGWSVERIADDLTKRNIPTGFGQDKWWDYPVRYILKNEKYIGDTLCQKFYTTESLPFINKVNNGEQDQYYVENTHPAIISKEIFEKAQKLLWHKSSRKMTAHHSYPLTLKIRCGNCGTPFARREGKSGLVVWTCRKHDKKAAACPIGRIPETELYDAFMRMYNKLKLNEGIVLRPALKQLEDLNTILQKNNPAMLEVNQAIAQTMEQSYNISKLQAAGLLDADACTAKLNAVAARLVQLRAERCRLLKNEDVEDSIDTLRQTADVVQHGPERLEVFREDLFHELVEQIIVDSQTRVRFRLYGGIELTEQLAEVAR